MLLVPVGKNISICPCRLPSCPLAVNFKLWTLYLFRPTPAVAFRMGDLALSGSEVAERTSLSTLTHSISSGTRDANGILTRLEFSGNRTIEAIKVDVESDRNHWFHSKSWRAEDFHHRHVNSGAPEWSEHYCFRSPPPSFLRERNSSNLLESWSDWGGNQRFDTGGEDWRERRNRGGNHCFNRFIKILRPRILSTVAAIETIEEIELQHRQGVEDAVNDSVLLVRWKPLDSATLYYSVAWNSARFYHCSRGRIWISNYQ